MILSPLFVIHVAQFAPQVFDNEEKGKKIMKLSYDITMLKAYNWERGRRTWLLPPLFMMKLGKYFHDLGKTETDKT